VEREFCKQPLSILSSASIHLLYSLFIFTVSDHPHLLRLKNLLLLITTNSIFLVYFWFFNLHNTFISGPLFLPLLSTAYRQPLLLSLSDHIRYILYFFYTALSREVLDLSYSSSVQHLSQYSIILSSASSHYPSSLQPLYIYRL
jgi:hypothetical protein